MTRKYHRWLALWLVCLTALSPWVSMAGAMTVGGPAGHDTVMSHPTAVSDVSNVGDEAPTQDAACHSTGHTCVACAIPASASTVVLVDVVNSAPVMRATRIPQIHLPAQERPPRFN